MAEEVKPKRKVNRSTAYPGITLEQAVDAAKTLRTNLGNGPYSRDSAAKALGYTGVTGTSSTKIAGCAHFGLLVREGNAYKQSDLANQIFNPQSDEEKQTGIKAASQNPTLYGKLLSAFEGKALPVMLDNILIRQYGIQERVAKEAATIFTKSAEFAGVLTNGIIVLESEKPPVTPTPDEIETDTTDEALEDIEAEKKILKVQKPTVNTDSLPVPIAGTDIVVLFPTKYAYELSIGSFTSGIKELAKNVKSLDVEDEEPTAPTEE